MNYLSSLLLQAKELVVQKRDIGCHSIETILTKVGS